jgi:hypothetical protein
MYPDEQLMKTIKTTLEKNCEEYFVKEEFPLIWRKDLKAFVLLNLFQSIIFHDYN